MTLRARRLARRGAPTHDFTSFTPDTSMPPLCFLFDRPRTSQEFSRWDSGVDMLTRSHLDARPSKLGPSNGHHASRMRICHDARASRCSTPEGFVRKLIDFSIYPADRSGLSPLRFLHITLRLPRDRTISIFGDQGYWWVNLVHSSRGPIDIPDYSQYRFGV
ncbi:hypothetical protein EDB86DRAFT_1948258 [Lactarius hatsudake]|nr:hypothetical protein EDB86DRAFT_1948258 [Lactarius hatsudake]